MNRHVFTTIMSCGAVKSFRELHSHTMYFLKSKGRRSVKLITHLQLVWSFTSVHSNFIYLKVETVAMGTFENMCHVFETVGICGSKSWTWIEITKCYDELSR